MQATLLALLIALVVVVLAAPTGGSAVVVGDTDCNGQIQPQDALWVLWEDAGLDPPADCLGAAGDIDCDGDRDAVDAYAILGYVVNGSQEPQAGCPAIGSSTTPTPTPGPTTEPPSGTVSVTPMPSGSPVPTISGGPTVTPTETPTLTPTATPTPTPTLGTPSPTPTPQVCDVGLTTDSINPLDAAKAMGICSVVLAQWVLPNGSTTIPTPTAVYHRGHAIRSKFGTQSSIDKQEGHAMLLLSTGTAAGWGDTNPAYVVPVPGLDKGYTHPYPTGFPKIGEMADGQPCSTAGSPVDGIGLRLDLTAPSGATGFAFDYDFFTSDYPRWVCSQYVDVAAVFVDGVNVMVDPNGQAINVNSEYVNVCDNGVWGDPTTFYGSRVTCIGTAHLQGSGYEGPPPLGHQTDQGAATGWRTGTNGSVVITPGEQYILIFAIWDSVDPPFDSTVLFDNFRWTYD